MTKKQRVLEHLIRTGSITSMDAINYYKATRLSAIIFDLRKEHDIAMTWETSHSEEYGDTRYGRYIYKGELRK